MEMLKVTDLKKTYTSRLGGAQVQALKGVTFTVESGEYVAIMGESGSGKTTLLNILAALDRPTGGFVELEGKRLDTVRENELAAFRRMAEGQPVDRLIWYLYRETGLLSIAGADKDGSPAARRANLMDCAVCTIFFILPWHIAVAAWYGAIYSAAESYKIAAPSISAALYNPYSWALLVVLLFSAYTGWNRKYAKDVPGELD